MAFQQMPDGSTDQQTNRPTNQWTKQLRLHSMQQKQCKLVNVWFFHILCESGSLHKNLWRINFRPCSAYVIFFLKDGGYYPQSSNPEFSNGCYVNWFQNGHHWEGYIHSERQRGKQESYEWWIHFPSMMAVTCALIWLTWCPWAFPFSE